MAPMDRFLQLQSPINLPVPPQFVFASILLNFSVYLVVHENKLTSLFCVSLFLLFVQEEAVAMAMISEVDVKAAESEASSAILG